MDRTEAPDLRSGKLIRQLGPVRRGLITGSAFLRIGFQLAASYPMALVLMQLAQVSGVIGAYFFMHLLGGHQNSIGADYLTFASLGMIGNLLVAGGLLGLGSELDYAIQQGRLETLLVEPLSWHLIPVGLAIWPMLSRLVACIPVVILSWALGSSFLLHGVPWAAAISVLGMLAGLAMGIAAASVRIIAKRADPVATIYVVVAPILSGQFFPLDLLPWWLRWMSWCFPSTYINSGLRASLMPHSQSIYGPSAALSVVALGVMVGLLLPISLWIFGRSLNLGRRFGILAGS